MSSELRVNKQSNRVGLGTVEYTDTGVIVSGIVTASSFKGDGSALTGIDATQVVTGNTSVQTVDTGSDGHVKVTTEGTERLRIDASGRILIGTTASTPLYPSALQVVGANSNAGSILIRRTDDSSPILRTLVGQSGQNISNSSCVGNWTGAGWHTDGYDECAQITMNADGAVSNGTLPGRIVFYTHKSGTGLTEALRITSSGQLAINKTSTISAKLHIADSGNNAAASQLIKLANDSSGAGTGAQINMGAAHANESTSACIAGIIDSSGTAFIVKTAGTYANQGTVAERFRITSAGNIGLGINNPSGAEIDANALLLHIKKNTTSGALIKLESSNTTAHLLAGNNQFIVRTHTDDPIAFHVNGGEKLRFASAGQIGIAGANYGSSGQVLTSQGSGSAVQWATPAAGGKLLQMVGSSSNNNTIISSTSWATTNISQSITPSKAGSKMLFLCAGHYSQNPNGGSWGPQVQIGIYKQIGSGTDTLLHQVTYDYVAVTTVYNSHHFAATIFDPTATSNTSDAIKYTIYAKLLYASHQMRFNPTGYTSLVIQEYDA